MTGHTIPPSQGLRDGETRNAICLCTDRRMLIPAMFVAAAARAHAATSPNRFDVMIFAEPSEVDDDHRRWMEQKGIILCDDMDLSAQRGVGKFSKRLSPATLMRLALPEHLAGRYDRILYLDADLTIHGDLGTIFSLDTGEHALAAVPAGRNLIGLTERTKKKTLDHFHALGMTMPYRYFNAGVLYIDVEKWNRENLGERALAFIRVNPDLCALPDEDALNAVLDGAFAQLSPIWNMRPGTRGRSIAHEVAQPVIIHHMGLDKPWIRYGYQKRLFADRWAYRLYEAFLKDTPWQGWLDEQWSARDLRANIAWEFRRISRRVRGRLDEPSARQRREHLETFRRYCAEERFVDVEQGVVARVDGKLRLKKGAPVAGAEASL